MKGHVVAFLSVVPIGTRDASLSNYVASCLKILKDRDDVSYQLTPMGTVVEGPIGNILEVTRQMHEIPFDEGVSRVITTLKIDERRDKPFSMSSKVDSVVKLDPAIKT